VLDIDARLGLDPAGRLEAAAPVSSLRVVAALPMSIWPRRESAMWLRIAIETSNGTIRSYRPRISRDARPDAGEVRRAHAGIMPGGALSSR
jgi:hypothetical protein